MRSGEETSCSREEIEDGSHGLTHTATPDDEPQLLVCHGELERLPSANVVGRLGGAALGLETPHGEVALDGLEHARVMGKLGHDEARDDANSDGADALAGKVGQLTEHEEGPSNRAGSHDEEPSPALDAVDTVKTETAGGDEATQGLTGGLEHVKRRDALGQLLPGVPGTQEVDLLGSDRAWLSSSTTQGSGVGVATHRAGEERSLSKAEQDSHGPKLPSVLDECGARADCAPDRGHHADV